MKILFGALLAFALGPAFTACAAQAGVQCAVDKNQLDPAETALVNRKYAQAEQFYRILLAASPALDTAQAGLVRALIGQNQLADALALATKTNAGHPEDPVLLDALGDIRFRRGEVGEAADAWTHAQRLDPCNGYTRYEMYRFDLLFGRNAAAQQNLDAAHTLWPVNPEIEQLWSESHAEPLTPQQRVASLRSRLQDASLSDEDKTAVQAGIRGLEAREKGGCEMSSAPNEGKLSITPLANGSAANIQNVFGAGLDVQFNGKHRVLEIDTGASGLLLTRSAAKGLGLTPELEFKAGGIGDQGLAGAFVAHVDDLRLGKMEMKNCMVSVLEDNQVMPGIDGLIGPDVFRDYLVTLDIPSHEIRLGPLPPRPGDSSARPPSLETVTGEDPQGSIAATARDRYIAPEMKDWTQVFRSGHFLIFPTRINKAPVRLFILDTGASQNSITPAAAREVTHVSSDSDTTVTGINGKVKNVMAANSVSLTFGGVSQYTSGMTSFDSTIFSQSTGAEISGLLGFTTLRELIITIDYRDNLVHIVYDPSHGFHAR